MFTRSNLSTNEKIMLASTFHSLYAIATKIAPQEKASGIQLLETDHFNLHCFQTITGNHCFQTITGSHRP